MESWRIRPIAESDLDGIVLGAGGIRAHPEAPRRLEVGADYVLEEAVIELKVLEDDGLLKPERQRKLAELFLKCCTRRPVIVIDRDLLPEAAQPEYDRILEKPIKKDVQKSSKQLKQSRAEFPVTTCSVLFVINNGYTALSHEKLLQMVAHRARLDTGAIDGIVVGGCYYFGDGIDSFFLWPLEYLPINVDRPFRSFSRLESTWYAYADKFMTEVVRGDAKVETGKGPVVDAQFDVDGITYVKPAPLMGVESPIYGKRRPRKGGPAAGACPPVAITFPDMTESEWRLFREALPQESGFYDTYEQWRNHRAAGVRAGSVLKPFVPISVTVLGWEQWRSLNGGGAGISSVRQYANALFSKRLRAILGAARERKPDSVVPSRYILVVTEEIGQDHGNDLTRIALASAALPVDLILSELVMDARIFHEHGLVLACAYALAEGAECVLWQKDSRYAWT